MIAINENSISHINSSIPFLQKGLRGLSGAQLPDGNLVIIGGWTGSGRSYEYLHHKEGFDRWRNIERMKKARSYHSSLWIDGRLLTTGGKDPSGKPTSCHEEFSFDVKKGRWKKWKERKEMPKALYGHTATIFDQKKMIVVGGQNQKVSQILSKLRFEK